MVNKLEHDTGVLILHKMAFRDTFAFKCSCRCCLVIKNHSTHAHHPFPCWQQQNDCTQHRRPILKKQTHLKINDPKHKSNNEMFLLDVVFIKSTQIRQQNDNKQTHAQTNLADVVVTVVVADDVVDVVVVVFCCCCCKKSLSDAQCLNASYLVLRQRKRTQCCK